MALHQIIYQSQSLVPFETPELLALLTRARAYNQQHGISGILLYTPDGRFLQVLEGEKEAVYALYYNRILVDPRHFNCRLLGEGPCQQRTFASWQMGFRHAQARHLRTLLGTVPPDTPALLIPRPHTRPELLAMLQEFAASATENAGLEYP